MKFKQQLVKTAVTCWGCGHKFIATMVGKDPVRCPKCSAWAD